MSSPRTPFGVSSRAPVPPHHDLRLHSRLYTKRAADAGQEKAEAISAAAREPALFAEMLADFPGSIPSDDNLRSYLVRKAFSPSALSAVIRSFRETMDLVASSGEDYDSEAPTVVEATGTAAGSSKAQGVSMNAASALVNSPPPSGGNGAYQISVMTDRLILNGTFLYRDMVEDLLGKLQALKGFLPERPEEDLIG